MSEVTITDGRNGRARLTSHGAALMELWAPDRHGRLGDVVLGFGEEEQYRTNSPCYGGTAGRVANRIANGTFELDGQVFKLPTNDGVHHLHGGPGGFHLRPWRVAEVSASHVSLQLTSEDGDNGYPGRLEVHWRCEFRAPGELWLTEQATTDRATLINLTNHSYFNLEGGRHPQSIADHLLEIPATHFTPIGPGLIPTGELRPVAGTAFDFRTPCRLGERLGGDDPQLALAGGLDHNFVLPVAATTEPRLAARLIAPQSGRVLEVLTTKPGLQVYTGNFLGTGPIGKGRSVPPHRSGICLETQAFPDAPNHPGFPSIVLRPGERYRHITIFRCGRLP